MDTLKQRSIIMSGNQKPSYEHFFDAEGKLTPQNLHVSGTTSLHPCSNDDVRYHLFVSYFQTENGTMSVFEADGTQEKVEDVVPVLHEHLIAADMQINVLNELKPVILGSCNENCRPGGVAKGMETLQSEDRGKNTCCTSSLGSIKVGGESEWSMSPEADAQSNSQDAKIPTRTDAYLQGPPVFSKARKSRRKHHLKANGKTVMKAVQIRDRTRESSVYLFHPSLLKLNENVASVEFKVSVESKDKRCPDKEKKVRLFTANCKNDCSLTVEGKAVEGGEKTLPDTFVSQQSVGLHRNSAPETGPLAEDPRTEDFPPVKGTDLMCITLSIDCSSCYSGSGVEEKDGVFQVDTTDKEFTTQKIAPNQYHRLGEEELTVNDASESNGREAESVPKEPTAQLQPKEERMLDEAMEQKRELCKWPQESFEQQRNILFWCAYLAIQAVGFQLKLMINVMGTIVFALQHLCLSVSYPIFQILQAKGKVTEEDTEMKAHSTEFAFASIKEAWLSVQPVLTTGAKRIGLGCLTATYVCAILSFLFITTFFLSFLLIKSCVHEPIQMRKIMHFDYTKPHPAASIDLLRSSMYVKANSKSKGVTFPANKFHVTVVLTLPESDHNRQLGNFQVTAELLSITGQVLLNSSQPCMLRFQSTTLRHAKSVLMAIPLLTGLSSETQTLVLQLLEWQEEKTSPSSSVRVSLVPRAGCPVSAGVPELYGAEIHVESELPWVLSTVRSWRWTLVVWTGSSLFVTGVLVFMCLCRQVLLPDRGQIKRDLKEGSKSESSMPNVGPEKRVSSGNEGSSMSAECMAKKANETDGKAYV